MLNSSLSFSSSNQQQHRPANQPQISSQSYMVITQYGDMLVVKQGVQSRHNQHHQQSGQSGGSPSASGQSEQHQTRPIIMTFHDLGLNSELQFATFCECDEVKLMLQTFTMIHVNFIGQESQNQSGGGGGGGSGAAPSAAGGDGHTIKGSGGGGTLPEDFKYPSVEQMAESIVDICAQLRVRSFIAIAVGAGAHIVGSLALMRPDLVDGLFLINPVITSCSITEWLYFKMSAIASNRRIGAWAESSQQHQWVHDEPSSTASTDSPRRSQTRGSPALGLRKLLNAAHIHLPRHDRHNNNNNKDNHHNDAEDTLSDGIERKDLMVTSAEETRATNVADNQPEDLQSVGKGSFKSVGSLNSSTGGGAVTVPIGTGAKQVPGSRLRQLIFSRNFRLKTGDNQHHHGQLNRSSSREPSGDANLLHRSKAQDEALGELDGRPSESAKQAGEQSDTPPGSVGSDHKRSRRPPSSSGSGDSNDSQLRSGGAKRPPLEYLMYHHFGSASFQRYRRSSDTPPVAHYDLAARARDTPEAASTGTAEADQQLAGTSARSAGTRAGSGRRTRLTHSCSRSHDGLERSPTGSASTTTSAAGLGSSLNRSGSVVCMEAACLAALSNDRQRHAYMQNVYRHYFEQLDAHNLWLFAQSFAKRRNLNLRKDCGAAAHAAAAAATLGTSICTAFVGLAPSQTATTGGRCAPGGLPTAQPTRTGSGDSGLQGGASLTTAAVATTAAATTTAKGSACNAPNAINASNRHKQHRQQAAAPQVAGTKVKRTFTCQTLIMCSSVQMHCERAFKLMSLLNPLQATWIKTDHLLVLEERPDKVCQALRLFLQGIGYSMSTYERRLRLSSATGSASSADSGGSARSLNETKLD